LIITIVTGLASSRNTYTIRQYAVGNRNFSTSTIVATIIITWISGEFFYSNITETFKLDKQSISCPMKFLEQIVKTRMNEYAPHHEVQKIQTKIIEHHKQLEMSKDIGGLSL